MDTRKLFILKQLSYDEATVQSFLLRLDYLQEMLKNCRPDYDCPFILSTIHSSKGLEYDRVYLMDICDGVFPAQTEGAKKTASLQERKELEEERRLFYVGMTREKNMLSIFKLGDCESLFLTELVLPKAGRRKQAERVYRKSQADALIRRSGMGVFGNQTMKKDLVSNFDLIIGERIVSGKYGPGTIADVEYEKQTASGRNGKFSVLFDSGEEKHFKFPDAFESSMKLENGETIEIKYV
jgi:DNA helicase-2/ATP-dependent DNA helicase PcrA